MLLQYADRIQTFYSGGMRCAALMNPRSTEQVVDLEHHVIAAGSSTPYLDWCVRGFYITTLSLKYDSISTPIFAPILIMAQSSLFRLECYSDFYDATAESYVLFPRITLLNLTSLRIGYHRAVVPCRLVDRPILLGLRLLYVHDFGQCPKALIPFELQDRLEDPMIKDTLELLVAMCSFTSVTHLKLRGASCSTTPYEDLSFPSAISSSPSDRSLSSNAIPIS